MRIFKRRNSEPGSTEVVVPEPVSTRKTITHVVTPTTNTAESPKSSRKGFPTWGKKLGHQLGKLKKGDSTEKLPNAPESARKRFRSTIENLQLTEAQLNNYLSMCQPYTASLQETDNISQEHCTSEGSEEKISITIPMPLKEKQRSFSKLRRFFSKSSKDETDNANANNRETANDKTSEQKKSFQRALSLNEISVVINNLINSEESGYSSSSARNSSGSEEGSTYVQNLEALEIRPSPLTVDSKKVQSQSVLKPSKLQKGTQQSLLRPSPPKKTIPLSTGISPKKKQPQIADRNKEDSKASSSNQCSQSTLERSSFHKMLPKPIMLTTSSDKGPSDSNSKDIEIKKDSSLSGGPNTSKKPVNEQNHEPVPMVCTPEKSQPKQDTKTRSPIKKPSPPSSMGSLDRSLFKRQSSIPKVFKPYLTHTPSIKRTRSTCDEDNTIVSLAKKRNTKLKDIAKDSVSLTDMKTLDEINAYSSQPHLTGPKTEDVPNRLFEKEFRVVHLHVDGLETPGIIVDAQQRGNPNTPYVISYITPGSPAERCGSLWIGDEVVKVNGARLRGSSPVLAKTVFIPDRHGDLEIVICRMRASRQEMLDSAPPVSLSQLNKRCAVHDVSRVRPLEESKESRIGDLQTGEMITSFITHKKVTTQNEPEDSVDSVIEDNLHFRMPKFVPDKNDTKNEVEAKKLTGMRKFTVQKETNGQGYNTLNKRRSVSFQATVCYRKGRGYKPLGIVVVGGTDAIRGPMGIYVKRIEHDGQAAEDGSLREGDEILTVNGKSVEGLKLSEAIQLIRAVKNGPVLLQISTKRCCESTNLLSMRADSF